MASLLDYLQPSVNQSAADATQAAIDQATQKPFAVVLSVDTSTQLWLTGLAIAAALFYRFKK